MKPDVNKIIEQMKEAYEEEQEKKKQETVGFVRKSDIVICIKVDDNYDQYSLADHLEDILDDIPAIEDFIIFTK